MSEDPSFPSLPSVQFLLYGYRVPSDPHLQHALLARRQGEGRVAAGARRGDDQTAGTKEAIPASLAQQGPPQGDAFQSGRDIGIGQDIALAERGQHTGGGHARVRRRKRLPVEQGHAISGRLERQGIEMTKRVMRPSARSMG